MLIWFSCIYKQNILSFFLFVVLVIHTYRDKLSCIGSTFPLVRNTVLVIFLVQYVIAVASLSSYNSPSAMPQQLLATGNVYPSAEHNYLAIPFYFNMTEIIHH